MSQHSPATTDNSNALASQANAWIVRLTSGRATVEDARALKEWCARSPQHALAYQHAARLWKASGRVRSPRQHARAWPVRAAASAAAACLIAVLAGAMQVGWVPDARNLLADHHTGLGERRQLWLPDGSMVELDARTRLNVEFQGRERLIELLDGAAVFHVKPDPDRPFVVSARNGTVTAIGTVFEVRHQSRSVQVTCTEGVVGVRNGSTAPHVLRAGEHLEFDGEKASAASPVDAEYALAWRNDLLIFNDRPLQDLVDELNRYRRGRIVIADPTKAQTPVSGVFHLQRSEEALEHIKQSLQLTELQLPAGVTLLR